MRLVGIILVILGALAIAYREVTYTKTDKIVDIGPIQASAKHEETIPIPPWASGGVMAIGVLLVIGGGSKKK